MSIIAAIVPAVQTYRYTIDQIADAIRFGRSLDELAAPAETDTTDHAIAFEPTADDAAWWADHCDHDGWLRDGELSPEEQDIELEKLDRYNDALEAMFEDSYQADMIERGIPCW